MKSGNVEALEARNDYGGVDDPSRGQLSRDRIRNLRYHIIVTVAMISRFCIEGGLDERESYALSDLYISLLDKTDTEEKLRNIHREVVLEYASRMRKINSRRRVSIHIIKALDYIDAHLCERISITDVSEYLELDRTYFGKLFTKEIGVNFSEYVRRRKTDSAENMLLYSEKNIGEISDFLGFASPSRFSEIFRKYKGMTPTEFRQEYYRRHWK